MAKKKNRREKTNYSITSDEAAKLQDLASVDGPRINELTDNPINVSISNTPVGKRMQKHLESKIKKAGLPLENE